MAKGRLKIWHKPVLGQLIDNDFGASRDKLVELADPPPVASHHPRCVAADCRLLDRAEPSLRRRLAPARGLANHDQAQFVHPFAQQRRNRFRRERAAIVKMFVQPVRHRLPKFRVMQALLPDPLRVAPGIFVSRG